MAARRIRAHDLKRPRFPGDPMNTELAAVVLACVSLSAVAPAMAQHHWGYSGHEGPRNWGKLDPKFAACAIGKNQSPVNLPSFKKGQQKPVEFDYKGGASEILNNGHTIEIEYREGSSLILDGHTYELKQFHFHAPSENTINGKHFPLEGHLVHADKDGHLAVVAILFNEGPANPLIASLWQGIPSKVGEKHELPEPLNAVQLLPSDREYYRFAGSLTTPPCSEGVTWLVVRKPVTASKEQIAAFSKAVGFANSRPVQPLNARRVLM
jgi:carbonic anhydrase